MLSFSTTSFCQDKKLVELRSCFENIHEFSHIKNLIRISGADLNHPVTLAYNYTGKLMLLDYSDNVFEKYRVFKTKTLQLDSIVHEHPNKIEIRMLRYVVHKKSPPFLRNNTNIANDIEFVKSYLSNENESLQKYIKTILKQFKNDRARNSS